MGSSQRSEVKMLNTKKVKRLSVKNEAEKIMKDVIDSSRTLDTLESRNPRCSALSHFCQIRSLISWIENKQEEECFTKNFYCDIGTAVHSVLQKWFGLKGHLYGLWKCSTCDLIVKEGFGPVTCKKCNTLCIYEEYSLNLGRLTGHCDGILIIDKKCYVLEFKTISEKGLEDRDAADSPYDYHINQVNMYVLMGQKLKLPYPLVGSIIVYISRNNPKKFIIFTQKGIDIEKIKNTLHQFSAAEKMINSGDFKKIIKKCKNFSDANFCPYKSICFKNNIEQYLTKYWKLFQK